VYKQNHSIFVLDKLFGANLLSFIKDGILIGDSFCYFFVEEFLLNMWFAANPQKLISGAQ
jgi:hypothetical protein